MLTLRGCGSTRTRTPQHPLRPKHPAGAAVVGGSLVVVGAPLTLSRVIRAMENRRENTRRTPADRSLSLPHQVREPLHELLRVDARPGPVADARADPGADAGSDNAPADAARELATRRLLRRRRRAGGSCSTSRSRRTRRRRSTRPSRPRACSCRATGCASKNWRAGDGADAKRGAPCFFLADFPILGGFVRCVALTR